MKLTTKQLRQVIKEELSEVSGNYIAGDDLWTFTNGLANQIDNIINNSGYRAYAFKASQQPWSDGRIHKQNYIIVADDGFHEKARVKVHGRNKFTVHSHGKGFALGKPEIARSIDKLLDILEILTPPK